MGMFDEERKDVPFFVAYLVAGVISVAIVGSCTTRAAESLSGAWTALGDVPAVCGGVARGPTGAPGAAAFARTAPLPHRQR